MSFQLLKLKGLQTQHFGSLLFSCRLSVGDSAPLCWQSFSVTMLNNPEQSGVSPLMLSVWVSLDRSSVVVCLLWFWFVDALYSCLYSDLKDFSKRFIATFLSMWTMLHISLHPLIGGFRFLYTAYLLYQSTLTAFPSAAFFFSVCMPQSCWLSGTIFTGWIQSHPPTQVPHFGSPCRQPSEKNGIQVVFTGDGSLYV